MYLVHSSGYKTGAFRCYITFVLNICMHRNVEGVAAVLGC